MRAVPTSMEARSVILDYLLGAGPSTNTVFLAEPYDEERAAREGAIRNALKAYQVLVADEQITNVHFLQKIMREIQMAQYGIADLTGHNTNVLLELGVMYGMTKPALILLRGAESSSIPSNLEGIEQLRYANYSELAEKLPNAMANVAEIAREIDKKLNIRELTSFLIEYYEVLLATRELVDKGFSCRIAQFRAYGGDFVAVVDQGAEAGLRSGLYLRIFSVDGSGVEEPVGDLRVKHVQQKISVVGYEPRDLRHRFWVQSFEGRGPIFVPPADHIVRPLAPPQGEMAGHLTVGELRANLNRYRALAR